MILCAVYSLVLLFFLSPDSYLRDLFVRYDSSIFFECGKAWMNGMIPYVDFTDSKGPLLWLIYGIGYLISHHSYVGVFWISVCFYTVTLFIAYRLCRLYLDEKPSAVATAALPFFLFLFVYHFEVRAEDFCYTFIMLSLYSLCRILKSWRTLDAKHFFLLSFAMGISCASCFMIKWNIAVMMLTLMAVALLYSIRGKCFLRSLSGMAVGFVLISAPFSLYLLSCGALDDFIYEFFINTSSMQGVDKAKFSVALILYTCFCTNMKVSALFVVFLCGLLCFPWKMGKKYWWLIACFTAFWIASRGVHIGGSYYQASAAPFLIFAIIPVVEILFSKQPRALRYTPALCVVAAVISITVNVISVNGNFARAMGQRQSYYRACYIMAQIDKPKIFPYMVGNRAGVAVGSLPACKYWVIQLGITDEMMAEREKALTNGIADFVIVDTLGDEKKHKGKVERVEAAGYVCYGTFEMGSWIKNYTYKLYGRPGLKPAPDDFYVSDWDVWLKRNIFGI